MTTLKLLHNNVCADRYDYNRTWPKRRPNFVDAVKRHDPQIVTLTECQQPSAAKLAPMVGMRYVSFGGSTILTDPDVLRYNRVLDERYWLNSNQSQSLLAAEFEVIKTGQTFNVMVSHLPPFAWRANLRKQQQAKINAIAKPWRDKTILATDANWTKTYESSQRAVWSSARLTATKRAHATYRTSGKYAPGNPIDYVLGQNGTIFESYDVINGSSWSDHHVLLVTARISGILEPCRIHSRANSVP